MDNFARALRLALKYRWNLAGSLSCALIVAVLWGGNFTFVYPLVEVCIRGKTLDDWASEKIADSTARRDAAQRTIAEVESKLAATPANEAAALHVELGSAQTDLKTQQASLDWYTRIQGPIRRYLPNDPFRNLMAIVGALLIGTLIKDVFLALNSILVDRLANLTARQLRVEFFRRTLRLDLASFGENGVSELLSRFTNDLEGVGAGIDTFFGRALLEPLKAIACFCIAAWISWQLLLISLVVAPLAVYLIAILAKTLKRANRKALEVTSSLYGILVESLSGVKVVKAFTMERGERRRFSQANKLYFKKVMRIAVLDAMVNPVTELMGMITISVAVLFGAYLAMNHQTELMGIPICSQPLNLGSLMMFFAALAGVSDPARKLSDVFNRLQRAAASSDRVYQLLDREPTIVTRRGAKETPRHHRELSFEGVNFHYHPSQPVLDGVDLKIAFGETVAIVGPNGCGKSTLANLILRFFDPISGSVRVDGVDLRDMRLSALRRQIGLVTQETLLFDDTVANNIRYGSPSATLEQVIAAAKQAHAHKFIEQKLDNGYQTRVGAQGSRLSGGQRQRIALARAILRDPAILVLDEATSQVDLESEQLIHKTLEQFTRNRTSIMITHRLGALALADRIVVMNAGRIVDVGSHQELVGRCEVYARLHQLRDTA